MSRSPCKLAGEQGKPRLVLTACLLILAGCVRSEPAPTLLPTAASTSPATRQSEEMPLEAYLSAVGPYGSLAAMVTAHDLTVVDVDLILFKLQRMRPPTDLVAAHELLVTGYGYIREGRQILDARPIQELRAEGEFQVDWGIRYIVLFQDAVATYTKVSSDQEREEE